MSWSELDRGLNRYLGGTQEVSRWAVRVWSTSPLLLTL